MKEELKAGIILFKEYCKTFNLSIVTDRKILNQWTDTFGPIVAGTFPEEGLPPLTWIDLDGNIWMNQNEDLLDINEPAIAIIDTGVINVSIANKKPIHQT